MFHDHNLPALTLKPVKLDQLRDHIAIGRQKNVQKNGRGQTDPSSGYLSVNCDHLHKAGGTWCLLWHVLKCF